jgi:hypothetical protein
MFDSVLIALHVAVLQVHVDAPAYRSTALEPLELQGECCPQPDRNDFSPLSVAMKADSALGDVVVQVTLLTRRVMTALKKGWGGTSAKRFWALGPKNCTSDCRNARRRGTSL